MTGFVVLVIKTCFRYADFPLPRRGFSADGPGAEAQQRSCRSILGSSFVI